MIGRYMKQRTLVMNFDIQGLRNSIAQRYSAGKIDRREWILAKISHRSLYNVLTIWHLMCQLVLLSKLKKFQEIICFSIKITPMAPESIPISLSICWSSSQECLDCFHVRSVAQVSFPHVISTPVSMFATSELCPLLMQGKQVTDLFNSLMPREI